MRKSNELIQLLKFREECKAKGQSLSKPKYERLTELLTEHLDDDLKLEVNGKKKLH